MNKLIKGRLPQKLSPVITDLWREINYLEDKDRLSYPFFGYRDAIGPDALGYYITYGDRGKRKYIVNIERVHFHFTSLTERPMKNDQASETLISGYFTRGSGEAVLLNNVRSSSGRVIIFTVGTPVKQ